MKLTDAMLADALTPEQKQELDGLIATLRQRELPDPWLFRAGGPCCEPYEVFGPDCCTCWVEVHEPGQKPLRVGEPVENREGMCSTCAFRPASPELRDDPTAEADRSILMLCVMDERREFFCHDGMRRTVAMRHPNGMVVEVEPKNGVTAYDPPKEGNVAFRMDGRPGLRCGGLVAARKARNWNPWRKDDQ